MGAAEEKLVLKFMEHADGREQDVDAMTALMADDIVWQINVPTRNPRVGREVARAELASSQSGSLVRRTNELCASHSAVHDVHVSRYEPPE